MRRAVATRPGWWRLLLLALAGCGAATGGSAAGTRGRATVVVHHVEQRTVCANVAERTLDHSNRRWRFTDASRGEVLAARVAACVDEPFDDAKTDCLLAVASTDDLRACEPRWVVTDPVFLHTRGAEAQAPDEAPSSSGVVWTVELGRVEADGAMGAGEVRRHLSLQRGRFDACFGAIHDHRDVAFSFMLNHRGEVATVIEAEDASLASCMEGRLRTIQFHAADGPTRVVMVLERRSHRLRRGSFRD